MRPGPAYWDTRQKLALLPVHFRKGLGLGFIAWPTWNTSKSKTASAGSLNLRGIPGWDEIMAAKYEEGWEVDSLACDHERAVVRFRRLPTGW